MNHVKLLVPVHQLESVLLYSRGGGETGLHSRRGPGVRITHGTHPLQEQVRLSGTPLQTLEVEEEERQREV